MQKTEDDVSSYAVIPEIFCRESRILKQGLWIPGQARNDR